MPRHVITPGALLAKRYRIDEVIAEGGMGTVYRAFHILLERPVAIKVMREELARMPEAVARFVNEARAAAQLCGPHALRVIDIGRIEAGPPYQVLELLEGADLRTVLDERGPLPLAEAVDLVVQACEAVSEAHALGIIHRDLKPENLFLCEASGGQKLVKLLDFGISKQRVDETSPQLTAFGESVGSPNYMSPEQMSAPDQVDERSDVWSLGVVLYELLTGTTPFHAETVPFVYARVLGGAPTPLATVRGDLPNAVQSLLDRCFCKDPKDRFANAQELSQALLRLLRADTAVALSRIPRRRGARLAKSAGALAACAALAAALALSSTGRAQLRDAGAVAQSMRALVADAVLSQAPR
jgi:serine/threonine-protein kinase